MAKNYRGTLFLIIGNSGSGKDSIISGIIKKYPQNLKEIIVPRRFITRPPSEFERNISITPEEFKEMEKKGSFALKWHIYELDYGIPVEIENWLEKGHPVIINVSRTAVNEAKEKYSDVRVIFVEVPFEITYQRIKDRKRESEDILHKRIERARKNQQFPEADFFVDNSGILDDAINQLLAYIISIVNGIEK
ncbi:MAG: phosphonate metabolism protein/1,5-bisphosphokinase (PRPP-forming) PhnN [Candidatus Lokiarchaeota archaeon]|nr:phosphonate metabolism protein/1,5-bisphosphokinase (PRPP-forming) PhnN [Candidatus Lokiarchaeota archaeon]